MPVEIREHEKGGVLIQIYELGNHLPAAEFNNYKDAFLWVLKYYSVKYKTNNAMKSNLPCISKWIREIQMAGFRVISQTDCIECGIGEFGRCKYMRGIIPVCIKRDRVGGKVPLTAV
ncbi:hypothetical protein [Methermicoccus shengliensis]|uniref:Uncharacterized protein n=1 Tax=Methermicoccus shengliensis TaxID=660064 RepID=A0A832RVQ3_9EURY|nr:hypothetical protein [Methermicoccus shengliensis]KUK04735.1 MAG: hypothetical protein XD46_0572 [Euryarchaeota archaeon 55_53]MDI3487405.1 hypothetical protein [Methanosarcinales archaeon]MDN5295266.1 hypothetical protein [Methanosarcinales archaeon]HIH69645.1 hypothetical protein [Methermicoccus shengliensis]